MQNIGQNDIHKKDVTTISVVVPCYNEVNYIERFIVEFFRQVTTGFECELIIADGMSNDGTRDVIARLARDKDCIRIIDNPGRIVSTGLNQAIYSARGEIIIRMDVHTVYESNYLKRSLERLETGIADNVGGAWRCVEGETTLQQAIACAFQTGFSCGGKRSHNLNYEGFCESVYLGCWYKKTLIACGMFDENIVRNQDDELNFRLRKQGKKIFQDKNIVSWYTPRKSLGKLFNQYYQYGFWKAIVSLNNRELTNLSQIVPPLFVGSVVVTAILSFIYNLALYLLFMIFGVYLLSAGGVSLANNHKALQVVLAMPLVFTTMHSSYGIGYFAGIFSYFFKTNRSREISR